jgi:hypothetical protein
MYRSARSLGASRPRRHDAGLVIVLAIALLGAPAVSALRNECNLCPPDCPMHQHHNGVPGSHLGCHGGGALTARLGQLGAPTHGPLLACATCGNHGLLPGTVLPPMIMPAAQALSAYAAAGAVRFGDGGLNSRAVNPPDTPPPIGAA